MNGPLTSAGQQERVRAQTKGHTCPRERKEPVGRTETVAWKPTREQQLMEKVDWNEAMDEHIRKVEEEML